MTFSQLIYKMIIITQTKLGQIANQINESLVFVKLFDSRIIKLFILCKLDKFYVNEKET